MPVEKVPGGYRWSEEGKVYPTKEEAAKQGRAIKAAQSKRKPTRRKSSGKKK